MAQIEIAPGQFHVHYVFPGYASLLKTHCPNGEHWLGDLIVGMFNADPELLLSIRIARAIIEDDLCPAVGFDKDSEQICLVWKGLASIEVSEIPDRLVSDRKEVKVTTYRSKGNDLSRV